MASFVKDLEEIRQRAINKIEDGAVTATYKGDVERTVSILNEALATEIVCVLRYMHHYFMATGVHGRAVADEFKEHADAEREHSDEIAERIQQLGGKPDFNPASLLQRSVSQYKEGESLADMIREDLIAERMVIEVYQEMIRYFGDNDPTTRIMIEHILSEEEEHASDLSDLLYVVDPHTGEAEGRDPGADPLKMGRAEKQASQASRELEEDEFEPALSQDDVEAHDSLVRNQRRPKAQETVRGRDREYDGTQEIRETGSRGRNRSATSQSGRGASAGTPGASGRPMNRRKTNEEVDEDEIAERPNRGAMSGGTRSPKILQKNRKNKRVA
ncbi:MAG TPA: ferritin-like domain-containing protein [Terriglobales bacterium]|nr:ferritin-like domain-containing protein [Terriglobales bacterium]